MSSLNGVVTQQCTRFLRTKAATVLARLSHRNSVRPSVCPSVCHTGGSVQNGAS